MDVPPSSELRRRFGYKDPYVSFGRGLLGANVTVLGGVRYGARCRTAVKCNIAPITIQCEPPTLTLRVAFL